MRSFVFAVVALVAVNVAADALIQYPIGTVQDSAQAGIFRDRQPRVFPNRPRVVPGTPNSPAPAPGTDGHRTAPVDPAAPPKFEGAPEGGGPVSPTALSPEQKQQLFTAISSIISLLIGAFTGSGRAGPFLSALLAAFKGIGSPAPAPVPTPAPATPVKVVV